MCFIPLLQFFKWPLCYTLKILLSSLYFREIYTELRCVLRGFSSHPELRILLYVSSIEIQNYDILPQKYTVYREIATSYLKAVELE